MSDDNQPAYLVEWMRTGLALFGGSGPRPSLAEIVDAAKAAAARTAYRLANGNVSEASDSLGVSRHTFHRAIRAARGPEIRQDPPMHAPFDDQLFPFIRTLWPATPDAAWVEAYGEWLVETIVPRAEAESTKIVSLNNLQAITGIPVGSMPHLMTLHTTVAPVAAPYVAGGVMYIPNFPLSGWFSPLLNTAPFLVKFATTITHISDYATAFFSTAGIPVPRDLSLD